MLWLVAIALLAVVHANPLQPDSVLLQQKARVSGFPNFVKKVNNQPVAISAESYVYDVKLGKTASLRQFGANGDLIKSLRTETNKKLLVRQVSLNNVLTKEAIKARCVQVPAGLEHVSWAQCLYASADSTFGYELYAVPANAKIEAWVVWRVRKGTALADVAPTDNCGIENIFWTEDQNSKHITLVGRPTCDQAPFTQETVAQETVAQETVALPQTVWEAGGERVSAVAPGLTRSGCLDMDDRNLRAHFAAKDFVPCHETFFGVQRRGYGMLYFLPHLVGQWAKDHQLLVRTFPLNGLTATQMNDRCEATSSGQIVERGHLAPCLLSATFADQGWELYAVPLDSVLSESISEQAKSEVFAQMDSADEFFASQCLVLHAQETDVWVSPLGKVQILNAKFERKADCDVPPELESELKSLIVGREVASPN